MKLNPLSIKKQEFSRGMRGFDVQEVQDFLDRVADEYQSLLDENESLTKEMKDLKSQVAEYRKIEKELQNTLLHAQANTAKTLEDTKSEAEKLVREAEEKARQIAEQNTEAEANLRKQIRQLSEEKKLFLSRLQAVVATQAKLLGIPYDTVVPKVALPKESAKEPAPAAADPADDSSVMDMAEETEGAMEQAQNEIEEIVEAGETEQSSADETEPGDKKKDEPGDLDVDNIIERLL